LKKITVKNYLNILPKNWQTRFKPLFENPIKIANFYLSIMFIITVNNKESMKWKKEEKRELH